MLVQRRSSQNVPVTLLQRSGEYTGLIERSGGYPKIWVQNKCGYNTPPKTNCACMYPVSKTYKVKKGRKGTK